MSDEMPSSMYCRRAVEALRNGVPNRDAVRVMGCNQEAVETVFTEKMRQVPEYLSAGKHVPGLLVSGQFGTGKSHLLEYLEHRALSRGFVCSRIVISKETPLSDPAKLYQAAIESAVLPDQAGHAIQEGALRLRNTDEYARFYQWCNSPAPGVSPLFPATLFLHERLGGDPELVEAIINFWSGERLSVSRIKQGLRLVNATSIFQVRTVPAKVLPLERFLFTARMFAGAGYKGWILFIDEVELIGRYSFLQRAKSYADLARWTGLLEDEAYPGILTVATITATFDLEVLGVNGKDDFSSLRPKLESSGRQDYRAIAARAEVGMRLIRRGSIALEQPKRETLGQTYLRLKDLYAKAYSCQPPESASPLGLPITPMRIHVRRWINEWDLQRLYPGTPFTIEEQQLSPNFTEDSELETPPETSSED
jgi:hypothetical protein